MRLTSAKQAVKYARKLLLRKYRKQEKRLVVEGVRLLEEVFKSGFRPDFVLWTDKVVQQERGKALLEQAASLKIPLFRISERELKELAATKTPQGVLAVVPQPEWRTEKFLETAEGLFLALDRIQDPGNLGTLIRTSDAVGVNAVFLSRGTVDLFNSKVLRSTMGSVFRVPVIADVELFDLLEKMRNLGFFVVAADPGGKKIYYEADLKSPRLVVVIGNEAHGIDSSLLALADEVVQIPLRKGVESLNAAVAAGILLYEAYRQRRSAGFCVKEQ